LSSFNLFKIYEKFLKKVFKRKESEDVFHVGEDRETGRGEAG